MSDRLTPTQAVLVEVHEERTRQEAKWGQQDWPWATERVPGKRWAQLSGAATARNGVEASKENGTLTYGGILAEEFYEAMEEDDIGRAREELIQVAAVAVAAIESIDRNGA